MLKAANNVNTVIRDALIGRSFDDQRALDNVLIELDGTPNKSALGANAILAVSIAFARASATERQVPLYLYFAGMVDDQPPTLPHLTVNLFSGGKHAGGQVAIQDVLLAPRNAGSINLSLEMIHKVYHAAADLIADKYGMRLLTADEGGLAPPFENDEAMLADAVEAIARAGFTPGADIALAIDVAASHFYSDGHYASTTRVYRLSR